MFCPPISTHILFFLLYAALNLYTSLTSHLYSLTSTTFAPAPPLTRKSLANPPSPSQAAPNQPQTLVSTSTAPSSPQQRKTTKSNSSTPALPAKWPSEHHRTASATSAPQPDVYALPTTQRCWINGAPCVFSSLSVMWLKNGRGERGNRARAVTNLPSIRIYAASLQSYIYVARKQCSNPD